MCGVLFMAMPITRLLLYVSRLQPYVSRCGVLFMAMPITIVGNSFAQVCGRSATY
tara:strand:+ start:106 stop:270 length:165 start_codon:yes stop_codon:yes gene_type:complete